MSKTLFKRVQSKQVLEDINDMLDTFNTPAAQTNEDEVDNFDTNGRSNSQLLAQPELLKENSKREDTKGYSNMMGLSKSTAA